MIYTTNNKFKFRSPALVNGLVYLVHPDGDVGNHGWNIDGSYGRSSPALDYVDYYAYFVSFGGGVDNYSNTDWDSCGHFLI